MFFNGRAPLGEILNLRRAETTQRVTELKDELKQAEERCTDKACVYATGSFGRGEASQHSDLDLVIVGRGAQDERAFTNLDEILIKADLINATRKIGIPDFSGDGEYLTHYTVAELVENLGLPEDDVKNTFTARLLLLLESSSLLGQSVYRTIIQDVINAYWKDYEGHEHDYLPAFLANDILRMWRTFCVNYEVRTANDPPERKAKRKLKNYKLKHSRLATCYSAILYLLIIFSKKETVTPADVSEMIGLTPTGRFEWMLSQPEVASAHPGLEKLINCYEQFLANTDASEEEMIRRFLDNHESASFVQPASQFGDLVFAVLDKIGKANNRFYRLLVV